MLQTWSVGLYASRENGHRSEPTRDIRKGFKQSKYFWDIWALSDTLSFSVALSFQWVLGHAGLSGNELIDLLAKTGLTSPFSYVSNPLAPVIPKIRHTRYANSLFCQIPSVSSKELVLPRLVRCELSRSQPLFVLSSMQDKTDEFFCSVCGHPLKDLTHLLLDCPASKPLRHGIFGTTFIFDRWSKPWVVARLLSFREVNSTLPSLGRGRVTPPAPI